MEQEQLTKILTFFNRGVARVQHLWDMLTQSDAGQALHLRSPVALTLMVWPMLWGFLYADNAAYAYLLPAVVLALLLKACSQVYDDFINRNIEGDEEHTQPPSLLVMGLLFFGSLWLALEISPLTLFLTLLWMVMIAIYPYLFKITWWPQLYAGVAYGTWPVLIGQAAAQDMSFLSLLLMPAAFLWIVILEILRAEQRKEQDLEHGLKSVTLWLGDKSFSFVETSFAAAFVFFVLTGMGAGLGGLYYAPLMLGQFVLVKGHAATTDKAPHKLYTATIGGSGFITLAFLLS